MKKIIFNKIKIKNFMSFGEDPVEFEFKQGLNLITGYNSDSPDLKNGIGKSSLCDALVFSVFDDTIKNLKKSDIVNDINNKNCEVELDLVLYKNEDKSDIKIKRGISPSYCHLYINDEDCTKSSIPLTNKYIEEVLGISKTLFEQSIIMSIGNSQSFFSLKKQDKRAFIEGVFNLDIFSLMLSDVRKDHTTVKSEINNKTSFIDSTKNTLNHLIQTEESYEDEKKRFIRDLIEENKEHKTKIEELIKSVPEIPNSDDLSSSISEKSEKLKTLFDKIEKVKYKIQNLTFEEKQNQKEIEKLKKIKDICSECGANLDEKKILERNKNIKIKEDEIEEINIKKKELSKKLKQANLIYESSENQLLDLRSELSGIKKLIETSKYIKSHIKTIEHTIEDNIQKIENKKIEKCSVSNLITEHKNNLEDFKKELEELRIENTTLETCKFILSEEGAKSMIISELKDFLNDKLNTYLEYLDAPVRCSFDEYFEETLHNQFNREKSYDSLSGGEKRRMDMAVLFTLQDLLKIRSGIDIQLAFYDEILDTSLCESGREKTLNILKEKSLESAIYIISHRSKMSDLIDDEIVLEKKNGFTQINKEKNI